MCVKVFLDGLKNIYTRKYEVVHGFYKDACVNVCKGVFGWT